MRARGPFYSDDLAAWVVARYDDVRWVLDTPEVFSSQAPMGPTPAAAATGIHAALRDTDPARAERVRQFLAERGKRLFMIDGAAHRQDRQRLRMVFTSRRITELRAPIRAICDELIDELDTSAPVDLVAYSNLVAARALARVLDLEDVRDQFVAWAGAINAALAPIPEDQLLDVAATLDEYLLYVGERIDTRRAAPGDDLLSAIVTAQDEDGQPFTTAEVLGLLGQFVAAGVATTSSSVASTLRILATRPELAGTVRADASLMAVLINEVLRLESPVQALYRVATQQVSDIGGTRVDIAPGDNVLVMYAAANRDPETFPDPHTLDLTRHNLNKHMAFGHGPHRCIGEPLGAAEAAIAVEAVIDRYTTITVTDPPAYIPMIILRGLATMPTTLA